MGWPHKHAAVHPLPIQLDIHHYESFSKSEISVYLQPRIYDVGVDKDRKYIIGLFLGGYLRPFVAPRADLNNNIGRVKIRIDGHHANVTVPIFDNDPLNDRFLELFEIHQTVPAEVFE